jgi:hypothetical protein
VQNKTKRYVLNGIYSDISKSEYHIICDVQHVDVFVYEMGLQERNLSKRAKIDNLRLSTEEWTRVGQFADLLSVCYYSFILLQNPNH